MFEGRKVEGEWAWLWARDGWGEGGWVSVLENTIFQVELCVIGK